MSPTTILSAIIHHAQRDGHTIRLHFNPTEVQGMQARYDDRTITGAITVHADDAILPRVYTTTDDLPFIHTAAYKERTQ